MMYRLILSRTLLVLCGVFASASANAFAIFVVPFGAPVFPGNFVVADNLGVVAAQVIVPAALGQGVPVTWKRTSKSVTLAFAPNPSSPLSNGTTTWNANALSAINEWASVGANFRFVGTAGGGNPCITDGVLVVAFDPGVCLGLPAPLLGLTRLVAFVDSPTSVRIVDADVAMITTNTSSTSTFVIWDAFNGPISPPFFDFRRVMLHELGHAHGLAHVDTVFGDNAVTRATVMHSQSVVETLSSDDKNGVLALYPPVSSSSGGGGGGSSNGLILALLLAAVVLFKFLRSRARHV